MPQPLRIAASDPVLADLAGYWRTDGDDPGVFAEIKGNKNPRDRGTFLHRINWHR
jgi:hypothetical protein